MKKLRCELLFWLSVCAVLWCIVITAIVCNHYNYNPFEQNIINKGWLAETNTDNTACNGADAKDILKEAKKRYRSGKAALKKVVKKTVRRRRRKSKGKRKTAKRKSSKRKSGKRRR